MQLKPINQKVWKCGNALVVSIDSSISQILGIEEGDILQIKIIGIEKPKITQTQVSPPEKLVEDNIERGAMLEITLPDPNVPGNIPSWKEHCLIPLSEKTGTRYFFPGYRVPFKIETDIGEIHTYVTSARDGTPIGSNAGNYIAKGFSKWYKNHTELQPGDVIIFEALDPGKRYKMYIKW